MILVPDIFPNSYISAAKPNLRLAQKFYKERVAELVVLIGRHEADFQYVEGIPLPLLMLNISSLFIPGG